MAVRRSDCRHLLMIYGRVCVFYLVCFVHQCFQSAGRPIHHPALFQAIPAIAWSHEAFSHPLSIYSSWPSFAYPSFWPPPSGHTSLFLTDLSNTILGHESNGSEMHYWTKVWNNHTCIHTYIFCDSKEFLAAITTLLILYMRALQIVFVFLSHEYTCMKLVLVDLRRKVLH